MVEGEFYIHTMNTYKSTSSIFINISLGNKKSRPIQFEAKTNGESTFSTSDEKLIEAIEKHPWFNKLFIKTVSEADKNAENVLDSGSAEDSQVADENAENVTDSGKTEGNTEDEPLKFTSLNDLKDYLLLKYPDELTVTKLNSKPKILAFINKKQLNIVFE